MAATTRTGRVDSTVCGMWAYGALTGMPLFGAEPFTPVPADLAVHVSALGLSRASSLGAPALLTGQYQ